MLRHALVFALVTSAATAQPNEYEIYPDATNTGTNVFFRGVSVVTGPGEFLQQYSERMVRGIGDAGTTWLGPPACAIRGMTYQLGDQDASTPDTFTVVVRDGTGMPTCGTAGELLTVGPIGTPPGVGFQSWNFTTTLGTPLPVPCAQDWYLGLRFDAAASFPTDGLALAASRWTVGPGDNPIPSAPTFAWEMTTVTPCIPAKQLPRHTWHVGVLVDCSTLNIGADHPGGPAPDPGFGVAGMFPDVTRPDGLCFRVRDNANAGGNATVFVSFPPVGAGFIPGLSLAPLLKGSLHMAGFTSLVSGPIPLTGEVQLKHPCFAPSALCMAATISWEFQAITFGVSPIPRMTNAQRTSL